MFCRKVGHNYDMHVQLCIHVCNASTQEDLLEKIKVSINLVIMFLTDYTIKHYNLSSQSGIWT